jgi:hypothetical protein
MYLIRRRWRRRPLAVGMVFAALTVNVWIQDGMKAFMVVLLAVVGCALVLGSVWWVTGAQVVRHSWREQRQIQSGKHPMREITR